MIGVYDRGIELGNRTGVSGAVYVGGVRGTKQGAATHRGYGKGQKNRESETVLLSVTGLIC